MEEEALSSVIRKLDDLLMNVEAGLLRGVETEVKGLRHDMKAMVDLSISSRNIFEENILRSTLARIAQDTGRITATFLRNDSSYREMLRTGRRPATGQALGRNILFKEFSFIRQDLRACKLKFCKEISSIQERLQASKLQFGVSKPETPIMRSEYVGRQQEVPPWEGRYEDVVVGLEEDVKLLLEKVIFNETRGLYTCCITGMGGIGKTTLAGKLYYNPAVMRGFEWRAWVCLSSKASQKEILIEIIRQLPNFGEDDLNNMEDVDEGILQFMLRHKLRGRRYFIVLDDIGEATHWEPVLRAFPSQDDEGSRLLLTSRTRISVFHAQYIHVMKILDPNQSWQLFLKIVFAGGRSYYVCPNHLKFVGGKIITKCNGLPLAIIEAGWHLAKREQSESEWQEFLESMDLSVTSSVLESSLHKLPEEIKSCFLSLAFFKEGTTIRAEKLVQIWTTAGIVSKAEEMYETAEEIARRYIYRLLIEYIVVIKDMTKDYRVKNIHINDNLHRLSIKKAKEDIGFQILKSQDCHRFSPHHLAICCSREELYNSTDEVYVFSLFFRGGGNLAGGLSFERKLKHLKILDFEGFGLKVLPEYIGRLWELRYLGLRNNYIRELPHSLEGFAKLEVLDIAQNFMVEVPDIVGRMRSLRHLYMSDIICSSDFEIDALENIETLTFIPVDNRKCGFKSMRRVTRLRKLGIKEMDRNLNVSDLFDTLAELEKLDCLILIGFRYRNMPELNELRLLHSLTQLKLDGLISRLPCASNFPPNVSYLTLVNCYLDEDPMPILEKLPKLFYLKLRNAYTGRRMVISRDGFCKLGVLHIGELWHLRNLQVGEGALPMLERLEINSCPYLETLPEEFLATNMQELKMVTTRKIARKMRDSAFISNIRLVDIQP